LLLSPLLLSAKSAATGPMNDSGTARITETGGAEGYKLGPHLRGRQRC
jgi:hypothetical protein